MFRKIPVYILIWSSHLEVLHLDSGEKIRITPDTTYATTRLVVADFINLQTTIQKGLKQLFGNKFLKPQLNILIQQMECLEGGLTFLEQRALHEIGERCGGRKVIVLGQTELLTLAQAKEILN